MLAKLRTYSLVGIEAEPVEVEVDISPGALPRLRNHVVNIGGSRAGSW